MCFISRRFRRSHILATMNPINAKCVTPIAKESTANISTPPPSSQALSQAIDHLHYLTQEHVKANQRAQRHYKIMMRTKRSYSSAMADSKKLKDSVTNFRFIVKNLKAQFGCTENPYSRPEPTELDYDNLDTTNDSEMLQVCTDSKKKPAETDIAEMPNNVQVNEATEGSSSDINGGSKTTGETDADYASLEARTGLIGGATGHGV